MVSKSFQLIIIECEYEAIEAGFPIESSVSVPSCELVLDAQLMWWLVGKIQTSLIRIKQILK